MKPIIFLIILSLLSSCSNKNKPDKSDTIISMQMIDRNGFTETISNKDRLSSYQEADFMSPQPFQKIMRVYGRNTSGQNNSKITSYHDNGELWQYLEAVDGRAHGTYCEWFPSGKQKIQANLIEGVADIHDLAQATWIFHGPCKVWEEEGSLIAEFNYEKGQLTSTARYYFPNGQLQKEIPYEKGEPHGMMHSFDLEGNIIEKIPYQKGEKEGMAVTYWGPEEILSEEEFENGRLRNASYFDKSNTLVAEVKMWQGKQAQFQNQHLHAYLNIINGLPEGEMQFFHPNGTLHCTYTVKDGKKNGEEWEYYPHEKGQEPHPKLCLNWNDDQIQGQVKTWYSNNQMQSQREINRNKKQGISFAWYKNGDLMLIEEYETDLLIKGTYYKKADKRAVSKIESGKGMASLYSGDGIFIKKVSYEKGKPLLYNDGM